MVVRKRLNIDGHALVFITTTVFEWKQILDQDDVVAILIKELQYVSNLDTISIISYVIMPSHIHILFGFSKIETLSKTIQMFKSIVSRQVKELRVVELKENGYRFPRVNPGFLLLQTYSLTRIR